MRDPLAETGSRRLLLPYLWQLARKWRTDRSARVLSRSAAALVLLAAMGSMAHAAEDVSREQMQGLDEQVQEIKSDVLHIAAELNLLEEKLLYPSGTQVSIFVAVADGAKFRLDSLQIQIDGAPVARHIYSFEELEALQKGGVQRLYTGNITTGEHQLAVTVAGKGSGGDDFSGTRQFSFQKDVEPKLIGMTLSGPDGIEVGSW